MILSNCRISKDNNVTFYEQDILLDNFIYTGDIEIVLKVDYISPGLGVALIADEGLTLNELSEIYLLKIGHSDYSIIKRKNERLETIDNGPLINIKPFIENMELRVRKSNNKVLLYVNNELISSTYLPTELNSYSLGYYSNAGNIIKEISISSEIPNNWNVNMDNTNGGYIKFKNNGFAIIDCVDVAELEQSSIELKANDSTAPKYYLKFDKEFIDKKNDIIPYVYISNDDRVDIKQKNILSSNNTFSLQKDTSISIGFRGKIGGIKNIQITNSYDDLYVSTEYNTATIKESSISIKTSELKKIEFGGVVLNIPINRKTNENEVYSIVRDYSKNYTIEQLNIKIGKENYYNYTIDLENKSILTIKNNEESNTINLNIVDSITIFENIDSYIDKLILYKKDGSVFNVLIQDTRKQYVPAVIKSPIIIMNELGLPLNLSSSYRVMDDNKIKYLFTNIEREVFEPSNLIKLSSKVSSNLGVITVYGVLKNSNINEDKIYHIEKDDVRSVSKYCNLYDKIDESDLYIVDKDMGTIIISEKGENYIKTKYKKIIVDYLKRDNYAINYKHELSSYEIDISTNSKTSIKYDGAKEAEALSNIQQYRIIDSPINDSYIVLKGR